MNCYCFNKTAEKLPKSDCDYLNTLTNELNGIADKKLDSIRVYKIQGINFLIGLFSFCILKFNFK